MEPFGLLNLLKTLLPQTENSTKNPTEATDKNTLDSAPATGDKKNAPDFTDAPPNAFLDFVSRHEERKRNIKK